MKSEKIKTNPLSSILIFLNIVSHLQVSILKRTNTNRRQRQIEEQKLISKFNCIQEGLNKDSGFLSHYLKNYNWPLTISTLRTFSSLTFSSIPYLSIFLLIFLTYVSPFSAFSFPFSYFCINSGPYLTGL